MPNTWNRSFEVTLRPLRDLGGPVTVVAIDARTAVQARRAATARFPQHKVLTVTRLPSAAESAPAPAVSGVVSAVVTPEPTDVTNITNPPRTGTR